MPAVTQVIIAGVKYQPLGLKAFHNPLKKPGTPGQGRPAKAEVNGTKIGKLAGKITPHPY